MTTQKPDPGTTIETVFWRLHDGNISWHIREREHYMVRPAARPIVKLRWFLVTEPMNRPRRS